MMDWSEQTKKRRLKKKWLNKYYLIRMRIIYKNYCMKYINSIIEGHLMSTKFWLFITFLGNGYIHPSMNPKASVELYSKTKIQFIHWNRHAGMLWTFDFCFVEKIQFMQTCTASSSGTIWTSPDLKCVFRTNLCDFWCLLVNCVDKPCTVYNIFQQIFAVYE